MKRRYNSAQAMRVIEQIRENIDGAQFTTDLMVGFPGESEENFLETVDFTRRAMFLDAHVFAYSRREGTPAAYYDNQITEDKKRKRSAELIRVKNEVRDSVLDKVVSDSGTLSAIAETLDGGFYTAHTDSYVEVKFASDDENLSGELVNLVPVSHKDGVVFCNLVNDKYK